jgi:ribosome-associated translation inhibitor RaiA
VKTNLTARNLEVTDRLRSEIERKLQRLDRMLHPDE